MNGNKKFSQRLIVLMAVATLILIALVFVMMFEVSGIQGNARVVNYAGIVRGATQRLVKNELYGRADDGEIARLDDILLGLRTGEGAQNLTVLRDKVYRAKLQQLSSRWEVVKKAIYAVRQNADRREELYGLSERYFTLADETVSAAEVYSDGIARRLNEVELLIIADIALIMALLIWQIVVEVRANRALSRIAYVDPNTGLPNKRSCDEKLREGGILGEGNSACCIMFDMNNLKTTNDTMGHEAGDALIGSFASLLRRTAPPDMFIGRFGGDEFIGIQMTSDKDAIAEFIGTMRSEADHASLGPAMSNIRLSFACGWAFSKDHNGCTLMTLMDIADKNMYANKLAMKAGR